MRSEKLEMINGNTPTRRAHVLLLLFSFLFSFFFLFSCVDPFELETPPIPPIDVEADVEDGYGKISISIEDETSATARTILPPAVFEKYVYIFTKTDETVGIEETPDDEGFFILRLGTYTVEVQTYSSDTGSLKLAASGESLPFTVGPGSNETVTVPLAPLTSEQGVLRYTITWPQGATGTITLHEWPDLNPIALNPVSVPAGNGKTQTLIVHSGSYLLTVLVNKGNLNAGISEAVHINPAITTEYTKNFTDGEMHLAQYTLSFDGNGSTSGTVPASRAMVTGSGTVLPAGTGFSRGGCTFTGWNTQPDGMGTNYAANAYYIVTGNDTLYARWTATVTYSINGATSGTAPDAQTVIAGSSVTIPDGSYLVRDSYTFDGWGTTASGGTIYNVGDSYTPTGNVTLYARFVSVVTYDTNGATSATPPAQKVTMGSRINLPSGPSKTGLTFDGWNTAADGRGDTIANTNYTPTGTITLYARWIYTVTFNNNSGSGSAAAQTALPGDSVPLPDGTGFTRDGYIFDGWNTNNAGTGDTYSGGGSYTGDSNITLYVKWANAVTYRANGTYSGTLPSPQKITGSSITIANGTGFTRSGYTFVNWNTAANGSGTTYTAGSSYSGTERMVLYAQWNCTVTFNRNNGTGTAPASQTVSEGGSITIPAGTGMSRGDYVFDGWSANSNGSGTVYDAGDSYTPTGNTTLYARWTSTVSYNLNGATSGTAPNPTTFVADGRITIPTVFGITRTGYVFAGWSTNTNGTGSVYNAGDSYSPSSANSTLYARWCYTVTFDRNGGSGTTPAAQTALPGASITLPSPSGITRTDYAPVGWNTNTAGTGTNYDAGSSYTVNGNVTLYVKWTPTVTVTFDRNGGSSGSAAAQTVFPGTSITLPSQSGFTRTGYAASGWNTQSDGKGTNYNAGSSYTVNSTVTLYVKWTSQISFNLNGGSGTTPATMTADAGSSITLPAGTGLSRSGYVFIGWNTSSDGSGTPYREGASYTVSGGTTLYAMWANPLPGGGHWFPGSSSGWYRFVANGYYYLHTRTGSVTTQLYDSNFSAIGSSVSVSSGSPRTLSTITSGNVYYLRVSNSNEMTLSSSTTAPMTTSGSLTSGYKFGNTYTFTTTNGSSNGSVLEEFRYRFTATASGHYLFIYFGTLKHANVQFYDSYGNTLGSEPFLHSSNGATQYAPISGTIPGQTYYARIRNTYADEPTGSFQVGLNATATAP